MNHRARGARGPVRRSLGWVLVRSPAQFYLKGEETGGRVPWSFLLVLFGAAAAGSGMGSLAALAARAPVEDWAAGGALVGVGAVLAWSVYSLLALLVMWLIGMSPEHVALGGTRTTTAADDNYQAIVVEEPRVAWRAKGEAMVPPALVAFFLFIAACFGVLEWGVNSWSLSRISAEDRVEVTAIVTEYREPAWWHPVGSPQFVVEIPAGTQLHGDSRSVEVPAETDRAVDVGDEVPLEVHRSRPEQARLVWTAEVWSDNRDFGRVSTFVCLGLAALSALALLFEQPVLRRSA